MLSFSEDLLFVWEPADLIMSWHAPRLPKWDEKNFSKKTVALGQNILISESVLCGRLIFWRWYRDRKLHDCSIINN